MVEATVPTLDARNTIPARLEKLGMSQSFFAALCSTNKAEFSRLLNGQKPLSGEQTLDFCETLDRLEELVKFLEPMTFSWSDPQATREWLRNPVLPNLFQLLANVRDAQQRAQLEGAKDADLKQVRRDWMEFLK